VQVKDFFTYLTKDPRCFAAEFSNCETDNSCLTLQYNNPNRIIFSDTAPTISLSFNHCLEDDTFTISCDDVFGETKTLNTVTMETAYCEKATSITPITSFNSNMNVFVFPAASIIISTKINPGKKDEQIETIIEPMTYFERTTVNAQ
jgi:hypothetical protein